MDKHLNSFIFQHVWAIRPEKLAAIMELAAIRAEGRELTKAEIQSRMGEGPSSISPRIVGSVGVLPIFGTIAPKMDLMTEMSGGSSIEGMQQTFRAMLADPKVESILLDIDSPGGVTDMVPEFAAEIRNARGTKPITAIANTQAASAALWLGSQADELYITPSGSVGSIGCFAGHEDISAQQEQEGIKTTLVKAGKFKAEFNPYEPLSDSARAEMQSKVDASHMRFVEDVAAGRGVDPWTVLTTYGEGRMLEANDALAVGMVDGVKTFDDLIAGLHTAKVVSGNDVPAKEGREMDELLTKFAEKLGITIEDGDDEAAVLAKADSLNAVIEPLRKAKVSAEKVRSMREEFPDEYAELQAGRVARIENEAHRFAENYERLHVKNDDGTSEPNSTKGFSAVVLAAVEDTHKKIAAGDLGVEDLKSLMDVVADEKNAIVEYAEFGSSRTLDTVHKTVDGNARSTFAELVNEIMVQDSLEYGAAVSAAAKKNPDLFEQYQNASVA